VVEQPADPEPARTVAGLPDGGEYLHHVRGHVRRRRVDDRAEVAER
jgi:hypothetical protein